MCKEVTTVRDERIDFLRFIGLSMIILAHVDPPGVIFQMRNFDVPLMVIVAGLSFRESYKDEPYLSYLWSRAKRLILPVWLFLSIYFLVILKTGYPISTLSTKEIVSSYLLLDDIGIGYVWIIRIFLLVATVSPFIYSYCRHQSSHQKYLFTITIIYLAYELILTISKPFLNSPLDYVFEKTILYLIPYSVVFSIGLRLPDLRRNQLLIIGSVAFAIFIYWTGVHWLLSRKFVHTQYFKYPPQSYYLSYAIFIAVVVWASSERIIKIFRKLYVWSAILFIGQNSMWIYLLHIPLIKIIILPFYLKYPLVFSCAAILTFLQVKFVNKHILSNVNNPTIKRNVRLLLTG